MTLHKPTPAQRAFLRKHKPGEMLHRVGTGTTYDFVGRVRDAGWIEIVNGDSSGWPYFWDGTKITETGLKARDGKA
jgi:hypothetical protein